MRKTIYGLKQVAMNPERKLVKGLHLLSSRSGIWQRTTIVCACLVLLIAMLIEDIAIVSHKETFNTLWPLVFGLQEPRFQTAEMRVVVIKHSSG